MQLALASFAELRYYRVDLCPPVSCLLRLRSNWIPSANACAEWYAPFLCGNTTPNNLIGRFDEKDLVNAIVGVTRRRKMHELSSSVPAPRSISEYGLSPILRLAPELRPSPQRSHRMLKALSFTFKRQPCPFQCLQTVRNGSFSHPR